MTPSTRSLTFSHKGAFPFTSTVTILLTPETEGGARIGRTCMVSVTDTLIKMFPRWVFKILTVDRSAGFVDEAVPINDAVRERRPSPGYVHRGGGELTEVDKTGCAGG